MMDFSVDKEKSQIHIRREFAAPLSAVWAAYTQSDLLDQWWAPRPWKANTITMDFKEGGHWLYFMEGPEGERHYCRADYKKISEERSFEALDAFCSPEGVVNTSMPRTEWETQFESEGNTTFVNVHLTYKSLDDLEKVLAMGMKEGFTMALENLDELLAQR